VDNLRTGSLENIKHVIDMITFIEADICDESVLIDVIKEGDVVVHLAALVSVPESLEHPDIAHKINVTGAHNVFVAAKNARVKIIDGS
jgi:nucleoside-diphosphate-sugar epimerase